MATLCSHRVLAFQPIASHLFASRERRSRDNPFFFFFYFFAKKETNATRGGGVAWNPANIHITWRVTGKGKKISPSGVQHRLLRPPACRAPNRQHVNQFIKPAECASLLFETRITRIFSRIQPTNQPVPFCSRSSHARVRFASETVCDRYVIRATLKRRSRSRFFKGLFWDHSGHYD